ncbi:uncharacterized protein CXorf38 isoform X2 [Centroberyx gerrardi]
MVLEELRDRLNESGYKNWLKAGRCLLILQQRLHPFINNQMRAFHGDLLNQNPLLRRQCGTSCRPRGNKSGALTGLCKVCSEWGKVILRHHRQPDATVNWDNCSPPSWSHDHWELAKAYMPRGQVKVKGADKCDASALLNLINYCDHFRSIDTKLVREMLRVDWSICVSGLDRMDAADLDVLESDSASQWETSADSISQWEAEVLRERLEELLHDAETQDTEQLTRLGDFLQANRDLAELFSAELQAISSLKARE